MKTIFVLLLLLTVTGKARSQERIENKVWQQVEALTRAVFETKDSMALKELVNSKVSYGHSGGGLEDKALMIQKAVRHKTVYKNIEVEKLYVDVSGKQPWCAIILGRQRLQMGRKRRWI